MTVFVSDTFTDTAGTILDAHTASDGGTWTEHANYGSSEVVISDANRLRGNATALGCYYHSGTPASAEYDVEADWVVLTDVGVLHEGIVGRIDTGADTMYRVSRNTSGQWTLQRIISGTLTTIGTFSQSLSAGVTYHVKLEIRDATKKVFIDGVERISSTDNTITGAGKVGVRFNGRIAGNTTDRHLDNLTATDLDAGGSPQNANLASIASSEVFGSLGISTTVDVVLIGITSAEVFGTIQVDQAVQLTGIPSEEAFGPTVFDFTVPLAGIPSAEAFGIPTIEGGEVIVNPGRTRMLMGIGQ